MDELLSWFVSEKSAAEMPWLPIACVLPVVIVCVMLGAMALVWRYVVWNVTLDINGLSFE